MNDPGCPLVLGRAPDRTERKLAQQLQVALGQCGDRDGDLAGYGDLQRTSFRKIALSIHRTAGWTQIRVTDSGPGIPTEHRERIFEPFVRVGSDRSVRGQGLGLAFCRMAIEAHGGTIAVEPGTTGGASFLLRLPASEPIMERRTVNRISLHAGAPGSVRDPALQILPAA